jgi:hypothetical protein
MSRGSVVAVLGAVVTAVACGAAKVPVDKGAAARTVIEEALAAKGGQARLERLKAMRLTLEGMHLIRGTTMSVEITRVYVFPDMMRADVTVVPRLGPSKLASIGLSNEKGWLREPDSKTNKDVVRDATARELQTLRFERWKQSEQILLNAFDPSARIELAPDEMIGNNRYSVAKFRAPFTEVDISLYINKRTKLIDRISYYDGSTTECDDFADYREVKGVRVAYKITSRITGSATDDRTSIFEVKSVEIDPEVDSTIFDKPPMN